MHFEGLLITKVYSVWTKKKYRGVTFMALNTDAKFEGKMTCAFKNDNKELSKFSPEHVWEV